MSRHAGKVLRLSYPGRFNDALDPWRLAGLPAVAHS